MPVSYNIVLPIMEENEDVEKTIDSYCKKKFNEDILLTDISLQHESVSANSDSPSQDAGN